MQFYYFPLSPPCRAVLLLLNTLNITPEMKLMNIPTGDLMAPEFLKINPEHIVPTIVEDDGFTMWESRAILIYIADKYAPEKELYPSDPVARAIVNQRLYFDMGTLFQRGFEAYVKPMMMGATEENTEGIERFLEAVGWLDAFLGKGPYVAGEKMSVADFSIVSTISSFEQSGLDLSPYKNITVWFNKCKTEMPNYHEANEVGAELLGNMVKDHVESIKDMHLDELN